MPTVDQLIAPEEQTGPLILDLEAEIQRAEADVAAVSPDNAIGRLSRQDSMQQQEMAKAGVRRREERIHALKEALRRMDEGTYAVCAKCREEIEFSRLELAPELKFCAECSAARA
ncbi:MAG: TraR/DksA C4-type zinc finger protein [Chthoniobacterales bacterium]